MSIEINDTWRINWDSLQWILQNKKIAETGKHAGEEKWIPVGFYANLDQLQLAFAVETFRGEDIQTLEDMRKVAVSVREALISTSIHMDEMVRNDQKTMIGLIKVIKQKDEELRNLRSILAESRMETVKAEKAYNELIMNNNVDTEKSEEKYRG